MTPRGWRLRVKDGYLAARAAILPLVVKSGTAPIPRHPRSILIISQNRLGDVSIEIPILNRLRRHFAAASLTVAVPAHLHSLIRWGCSPDHVVTPVPSGETTRRSWDLGIDFTTDYHIAPARLLRTAQVRIGFDHAGRRAFFHHALDIPRGAHMRDVFERIPELLGVSADVPALANPFPKGTPDGRIRIGVHAGAHHPTQRWPEDHYAELTRLARAEGFEVEVAAGPEDTTVAGSVIRKSGLDPSALRHLADPLELARWTAGLTVFVGNNSGPLHLAGLVGVPTLSFMGPTIRERWMPLGADAVVLRRDDLPCIGCNGGYCRIGTHECMTSIAPAAAFQALRRMVRDPAGTAG